MIGRRRSGRSYLTRLDLVAALVSFVLLPSRAWAEEINAPPAGTPSLVLVANIQLAANEDNANDPLEGFNRAMFALNEALYDAFLRPVAKTYNEIFPQTFRAGVSNALDNLSSPVTFINDLLQGEIHRALQTLARFVVNSTGGMLGIVDLASEAGMTKHEENFGQTLAVWGIGEGFYLVLPLLGPSNPRDAIGKYVVDPFFDPLALYLDNIDEDEFAYSRTGVSALDEFAGIVDELDHIKKTSIDYYAAIRSLYRQKRDAEISNGENLTLPPLPDYELNFSPEGQDGPVAGVNIESPAR